MFHNVYDMSTTTTPSRARPALIIPGADSRSHFDGKTSMMLMGGLPTPPHSALESRRPSLQFGSLAEYAPSAGSTIGAFSQPSTPVRGMSRHGDSYSHSWTDHAATTTHTPSHLANSFSSSHLSQALVQPAYQTQAYSQNGIDDIGAYATANVSHHAGSFGSTVDASEQSMWSSPQHVQQPMAHEVSSSLGPPLFAMSHGLASDNNTSDPFGIQHTQYGGQSFATPGGSFHSYATVPSDVYTQPQVVVPSHLSPEEDYSQQQYHGLTASPHHTTGSYSTSFGSSLSSDFELVRPPSPSSNYFAQSDEEEYIKVEFDSNSSPSYKASQRHRPRRRGTASSRRPRNNGPAYTYSHWTGDTEVVCENFNPRDGLPITKTDPNKKAHRCAHVYADGTVCGVGFQRSEHLKRHAGKHSTHRPYPCPLPKCTKEIQRPDNAADHFKTHLKPPKKGKRNPHFEWSFVRKAIESAYQDKKRAGKLLENLQKWVDAGMPESASQRQGNPNMSVCDGGESGACHPGRGFYSV